MTLEIVDDEAPQVMTPKQAQAFLKQQLARWSYLVTSYGWNKDELEEVMIHELTHLLLAPMQADNGQDNTERCVTMVSRLFKGLRS